MSDFFTVNDIEFENDEIEEVEESSIEDLSRIVSYNVSNTVEVLKFKIDEEEIDLKPEFQRDFVWDMTRASLFIDSLLIGLPIPSIFLGKSKEDEKYIVIDGQQRLKSVYYFMLGEFISTGKKQIFSLRNLHGREWNGKTYAELDVKFKRRIRNAVLNTTVIEDIDSKPRVVHDIFQRLNTGGMSLLDQEIRNCIYNGQMNKTLFEYNNNEDWRVLLGKTHPDARLRDVELVLRFFALLEKVNEYHPSMREFLSSYQQKNASTTPDLTIFAHTVRLIRSEIGQDAFKISRSVNKSVCDAVTVSIAQILLSGKTPINLSVQHKKLLLDKEFIKFVSSGTSTEASVKGRIDLARNYYLGLK
jgi:hypothetical protein